MRGAESREPQVVEQLLSCSAASPSLLASELPFCALIIFGLSSVVAPHAEAPSPRRFWAGVGTCAIATWPRRSTRSRRAPDGRAQARGGGGAAPQPRPPPRSRPSAMSWCARDTETTRRRRLHYDEPRHAHAVRRRAPPRRRLPARRSPELGGALPRAGVPPLSARHGRGARPAAGSSARSAFVAHWSVPSSLKSHHPPVRLAAQFDLAGLRRDDRLSSSCSKPDQPVGVGRLAGDLSMALSHDHQHPGRRPAATPCWTATSRSRPARPAFVVFAHTGTAPRTTSRSRATSRRPGDAASPRAGSTATSRTKQPAPTNERRRR